jgi:hypothetical protein
VSRIGEHFVPGVMAEGLAPGTTRTGCSRVRHHGTFGCVHGTATRAEHDCILLLKLGLGSPERLCRMKEMILESCHSTWVFEVYRKRFCRVLKGIEISYRAVSTDWRPYSHLEVDTQSEEFVVYLNEERTHLIRSWRHTGDCAQCGGHKTTELSMEDIHNAIHA